MRSTTRPTLPTYQSMTRWKRSLKPTRARSMPLATRGARRPNQVSSTLACWRLRTLAASDGLNVIASTTDRNIAETIVAENCR